MISLNKVENLILISLSSQKLTLLKKYKKVFECIINTSLKGPGQLKDSFKTPLGYHYISDIIGSGLPSNTIYQSRKPLPKLFSNELFEKEPLRDWILSRIFRLKGLESGFNSGGDVDTYDRYIYIHGAPDQRLIHPPSSHGCIRISMDDCLRLESLVQVNTPVIIYG